MPPECKIAVNITNMSASFIKLFKSHLPWAVAILLTSNSLHGARSVVYYGATWTFSDDRPTGFFVNGEPWVVGPVTITAISPNNDSVWDESYPGQNGPNSGSMRVSVPNTFQGYFTKRKYSVGLPTEGTYYDSRLDVSRHLPVTVMSGEMLMTAVGQPEFIGGVGSSNINEICVLTVLAEAPPAGSFRPPLFSTSPRVVRYNKSAINYSILKNLPPVPATPSQPAIELLLPPLPWFEYDNSWVQTQYGPANNFATNGSPLSYPNTSPVYGREIAFKWGQIALWLNTANSQAVKEKAMIQTIQCGLDIASFVRQGGIFNSDGGHKVGRKFPMLLAGLALNDSEILGMAADQTLPRFSEDQSTFIVQPSDVGRVVSAGIVAQYTSADVGLADWGVKHFNQPYEDDSRWEGGVPYRYVTWPAMVGCVLAVDLMEQKAAWNHPAIFAYNERMKARKGLGDGLALQMWDRYKILTNGAPSPPQGLRVKP